MKNKTDMIFVIGEVLYDVFPDTRRIGGAPFNFAFHLLKMGFAVKFMTRIGADAAGDHILELMQQSGFDMEFVQRDESHSTGKVMVSPDEKGGHQFEIVPDAAYDHIVFTEAVKHLLKTPPALIYFGTLVQRTPAGRQIIDRVCRLRSPESTVFYDINLRPECYRRDVVQQSLADTDILKLNNEELDVLADMFSLTGDTPSKVKRLIQDYSLTMAALTKGARGSEIFTGTEYVEMAPNREYDCVDTVGAGDAFAAVLAAGYLKNRDIRQVLAAATDFAGRICGITGAIPEKTVFYRDLLV